MNVHFFWYEMPLCDYVGCMFLSAYTEMYFVSITKVFFLIDWEMKGCDINISSNQEKVKNTVNHIYIKK